METLALAWRVLCALTAHKHAHAMDMEGKHKNQYYRILKNWSELRHRAVAAVLGRLCLPHGRVFPLYTMQNHQNGRAYPGDLQLASCLLCLWRALGVGVAVAIFIGIFFVCFLAIPHSAFRIPVPPDLQIQIADCNNSIRF